MTTSWQRTSRTTNGSHSSRNPNDRVLGTFCDQNPLIPSLLSPPFTQIPVSIAFHAPQLPLHPINLSPQPLFPTHRYEVSDIPEELLRDITDGPEDEGQPDPGETHETESSQHTPDTHGEET